MADLPTTERTIVYIDGFNLYHGLKAAKLKTSRWLDLDGMCRSILLPHQDLQFVRYFTAMIKGAPDSAARQAKYLNALRGRGGVEIELGFYQTSKPKMTCRSCGGEMNHCPTCSTRYKRSEEKQSDVNLALWMLRDALHDRYDTALLVSGDSDLVPAITTVKQEFPAKNIFAAFPPDRWGKEIANEADGAFRIDRSDVRSNRLPETVTSLGGFDLVAPDGWLPRSP